MNRGWQVWGFHLLRKAGPRPSRRERPWECRGSHSSANDGAVPQLQPKVGDRIAARVLANGSSVLEALVQELPLRKHPAQASISSSDRSSRKLLFGEWFYPSLKRPGIHREQNFRTCAIQNCQKFIFRLLFSFVVILGWNLAHIICTCVCTCGVSGIKRQVLVGCPNFQVKRPDARRLRELPHAASVSKFQISKFRFKKKTPVPPASVPVPPLAPHNRHVSHPLPARMRWPAQGRGRGKGRPGHPPLGGQPPLLRLRVRQLQKADPDLLSPAGRHGEGMGRCGEGVGGGA